jgi:hypothetical protein
MKEGGGRRERVEGNFVRVFLLVANCIVKCKDQTRHNSEFHWKTLFGFSVKWMP